MTSYFSMSNKNVNENDDVLSLYIDGETIQEVDHIKYLGHFIYVIHCKMTLTSCGMSSTVI